MKRKVVVLTESQIKKIISEQVQLMSVLSANPALLSFTGKDNGKEIYISLRDQKTGQVIPNSTYKYEIKAEYGMLGFDVVLRGVSRNAAGDLTAQATPASWMGKKAMGAIPAKYKTKDGWLWIQIPNAKVTQSLTQLKQTQGRSAKIDAGNGVKITLSLV
jgi:hypothetical protein